MKNKAWVMDTTSFSLYLWAIDENNDRAAYPIAMQNIGLIFEKAQFTSGTITKFTLKPIESTEVQNHTRYIVHLWPVHFIPSSSKITVLFPPSINLTEGSCEV